MTANAGADKTAVEPWSTVTLDGTGTAPLVWTQTAGAPTVVLSGAGADPTTFVAPGTIAGTTLTFRLTDATGAGGSDTMTVTVLPVTERVVVGGVEVPAKLSTA